MIKVHLGKHKHLECSTPNTVQLRVAVNNVVLLEGVQLAVVYTMHFPSHQPLAQTACVMCLLTCWTATSAVHSATPCASKPAQRAGASNWAAVASCAEGRLSPALTAAALLGCAAPLPTCCMVWPREAMAEASWMAARRCVRVRVCVCHKIEISKLLHLS